jgi:hypothetical protein
VIARILALLMAALLLAHPAAAHAHQQKIAISTVEHNPRSGMLEVVHRIILHDAEHALQALGQDAPDIINDLDSRRAFARYVAERFTLETGGGGPIALTLLGTEIEGRSLLVYQEGKSPGPGAELRVNSQIMTDVWFKQENRVNLGGGTVVETLVFTDGGQAQSGVLP